MIRLYKLSDQLQDVIEAFDVYYLDETILGRKIFYREEIEIFLENVYTSNNLDFKKIRREKTTTYILPIEDPESEELVDVKLTFRFDENNVYSSHKYYNINFNKDFEFFVESND